MGALSRAVDLLPQARIRRPTLERPVLPDHALSYNQKLDPPREDPFKKLSASEWGEVCSLMVTQGADTNIIDVAGDSLLCRALRRRDDNVVFVLLGLGADADPPVPSLDGASVLSLAITQGQVDFCHRL